MIPIIAQVKARSLAEFGSMVCHDGQEFIYVLEGAVVVHTEFYDAVTLARGEAIYIDSSMGHAYVLAEHFDQALILCVCSTTQEVVLDNAAQQIEDGPRNSVPVTDPVRSPPKERKSSPRPRPA